MGFYWTTDLNLWQAFSIFSGPLWPLLTPLVYEFLVLLVVYFNSLPRYTLYILCQTLQFPLNDLDVFLKNLEKLIQERSLWLLSRGSRLHSVGLCRSCSAPLDPALALLIDLARCISASITLFLICDL